jgi:pyruvate formate lyase activating enzyme
VGNRIVCRIPHIPDFNTSEDQNQSQRELREMGITRIERFNYFNNSKTYDGKREM